jgi:hypothetical protein
LSSATSSVQFNATSYVVNENAGSVSVSVTRTGNTANAVTINYATSDGSAKKPSDYTSVSGSLQFAAGETVKSFVVPILDDTLVEGNENINVVLSSPGSGTVQGSPFTSTITILDDDKPLLLTEENSSRAIALESVWFMRDPFSLGNTQNFSSDHHTRVMLFATGIELQPGESPSAVVVQLEDSQNHIYPLVVEDVRNLAGVNGVSQIIVKLPDSIQTEGDFRVTLTFRGVTSNKPVIALVH